MDCWGKRTVVALGNSGRSEPREGTWVIANDFLSAAGSRMLGKGNGGSFPLYRREGRIGRLCGCADSCVVDARFSLALRCVAFLPGLSRARGRRNYGMGETKVSQIGEENLHCQHTLRSGGWRLRGVLESLKRTIHPGSTVDWYENDLTAVCGAFKELSFPPTTAFTFARTPGRKPAQKSLDRP